MRYSIAAGAAIVAAANASPLVQARTAPSAAAPAGCSPNYSGKFQIQTVNVTSTPAKRDLNKRQDGTLLITLSDGTLTDEQGRVADIVANGQFQFDPAPGQPGYIYNSGFSACQNGSLALGGSTVFYQCLSGDFYNIYDRSTGAQCSPIYITILSGSTSGPVASQQSDGQPTAKPASQISDGQVQATTAAAVTQISDGQIQASTAAVTQISDGQVQAPTAKPVTQISDGQVQAPTAKPVTQISDGQVQAPTGKPVTQISDGQVQAPTGKPVTQISDGQIQAPTNGTSKPTQTSMPVQYTGAASKLSAAGLLGLAGAAVAFL